MIVDDSGRVGKFVVSVATMLSLGLVAACASEPTGPPQDQNTTRPAHEAGSVWVADEAGDSLTVIDAPAQSVAVTLTGLRKPHNVQVDRDAAMVYATSGSDNMLVAIDTKTYQVAATAPTGPAPTHVIEAPNGKVYVANSADGTVSVYQSDSLAAVGRITVGGMPHGLRAAGDGSVIVVANTMSGSLDLIDPATDRPVGSVPVGTDPAQVAVTTDGRYAYAGITEPASVVKVDLVARKVIGSAPVPSPPVQVYLTPDGSAVLSANQGTQSAPGNTTSIIDTDEMAVRANATTAGGPHGVVVDNEGTQAWVTNTYDDTVSVIDVRTAAVVATIPTGSSPTGISYSPHGPEASGSSTIALDIPAPETGTPPQPPHDHGR